MSNRGGASLPRLAANAISPRSRSIWARWSSSQRSGLCDDQQSEGCFERAGLLLGLGRGQRPPSATRGLGRKGGGALQERGGGRQPTAGLSAARRALKLGRDLLVGPFRRVRKMPGAAIGIEFRVRRVRERAMHLLPVFG